jgi:N-acetylmuramoyl-L-alanine amidase
VAVDAGHPPGGATGPTGLHEDSVTLAVAQVAARRLAELGARPVLVRSDSRPMSLEARLVAAEQAGAHLFVSIHVNAPADGRPPWGADGTETFIASPLALELAQALGDSVAASTGQRRRGPTVADLAVLRATWFPTVLIEGTCLVLPDREAWMRTAAGIEAYSNGIIRGLTSWASQTRAH